MEQHRKIIHIDMDAFFAAVELRDRPELVGLPVVVSSHHPRAVIATASYPARAFGLRSAMPMHHARKLCPDVVVVEPNFAKYREVSEQVMGIFRRYTALIEPLSLDEAYLDVTVLPEGFQSATAVAQDIRETIFQQTGLTASAGVAPNKFLAKVASDWRKPDGLFVIKPNQIQQFVVDLPLGKIPGVGRVTQQKLAQMGLHRLADLQQLPLEQLQRQFGKYGQQLHDFAFGIDPRAVQSARQRQQISKEITFEHDLPLAECQQALLALCKQVWRSLQHKQLQAYRISAKLKRPDFKTTQLSQRFGQAFASEQALYLALTLLLKPLDQQQRYRLVGVGVGHLEPSQPDPQMALWPEI